MKLGDEISHFPYQVIWEEIDPFSAIGWETLELKREEFEAIFRLAKSGDKGIPYVDETILDELARPALGKAPTQSLISRLYLLAGWQVTGQFQSLHKMDLKQQRAELRRLHRAALEFWEASLRLSGHSKFLLSSLRHSEAGHLQDGQLDIDYIANEAHDILLVARRVYEDTSPKKVGRRTEFRRETTVGLAAETIEAETGEPITSSRGNGDNPAPHFTNAGGLLLRDFFKLVAPKLDERLLVQSLVRVRARRKTQKNSLPPH